VQVTRQNAGHAADRQVDLLIASQVHRRELDAGRVQPDLLRRQSMIVRADDGAASLADMANRRIGVDRFDGERRLRMAGADELATPRFARLTGLMSYS
jgi:hypothetical protein